MASVIVRRLVVALALAAFLPVGTIAAEGALEIYFIDTEGGQATLLVSPTGGTLLIDTGFAGLDTANPDKESGRDAARIAEVAKSAGVKQQELQLLCPLDEGLRRAAHYGGQVGRRFCRRQRREPCSPGITDSGSWSGSV